MGVIGFKTAKCKDCYKCVRLCQVKAIHIVEDHVQFMANECIGCGQCLESCPQNAIVYLRDVDRVKNYIRQGFKTVVSLAPAYIGVFGDAEPGQLASALRKLGFDHIRETAEAAAYVTQEYIKASDASDRDDIILTSACSAINNLIEKYHPDMLKYLTPVVTPMIAHARMLREKYGPDVKIVYISPCASDGADAMQEPRTKGVVDAVLDFVALREWLRESGIRVPECENESFDNPDPKVMRLYAVNGGVLSTIKANKGRQCSHKRLYVSGINTCEELFDCIRNGEIRNCVIELNSCIGGCINGPMTGSSRSDRFKAKISVSQRVEEHQMPEVEPLSPEVRLYKKYMPRPVYEATPTETQIRAILAKINKNAPEKELNCGACGYPTCREKAIGVYRNEAELNMCIPYMYEQAKSMSDVILAVTPSIIIVVDDKYRICEFNNAAEVVFGQPQNKVLGLHLKELIPLDNVERVFKERRSLINQRVDYDRYQIKTMQNIVYMRGYNKVLFIIRDITEEVRKKEQLNQVKLDSVAMAQNVINKQMMVAQEIAGLLGETTAETKSTLRKLRDTLMHDEDEDA